jgi:hypothetical protein
MHQGSMRKLLFALRAVMLGIAVAMPVSADAPNSGPDRQYEDFTASERTITDRFTGLVWERSVSSPRTFADAKAYCANASRRLPSMKELLTLVDEEPHDEYEVSQNVPRLIDRSAFPKTPAEDFWTSSLKSNGKIGTVNFRDGTTGEASETFPLRVRCVESL